MRTGLPAGDAPQTRGPRAETASKDVLAGQQAWRSGHALTLAGLTRAITLMETAAQIENDLAASLRALAAGEEGEAAARRLRLAREAVKGAQQASAAARHAKDRAHALHLLAESSAARSRPDD